jgi:CHAT domain-containing protein
MRTILIYFISSFYCFLLPVFGQNIQISTNLALKNRLIKELPSLTHQQYLLRADQSLLAFYVGEQSVHALIVRSDTVVSFDFNKNFPLETWVKQLRFGLFGYQTAAIKTEQLYEETAETFAVVAYQCYTRLIAPLSIWLKKEVIIVPDDVLHYLPFDALLTVQPIDPLKFERHSYFGRHHIISYNYTSAFEQDGNTKPHRTTPYKKFGGFAPYYSDNAMPINTTFRPDAHVRKGLDTLKYSGAEVLNAQKLMQGDVILSHNATRTAFENAVGDYRIVHLATHGKANSKTGDYCFLAFSVEKDQPDHEFLYVRDIYSLNINADLVVLSACETGIGELKRGEGVISLARAFAHAGAKSLVTTLWSVHDKSTMHIMASFYKYLQSGWTKDAALAQAKMDYLAQAKREMAHPFYWAAFVPIGDMRAVR